MSELVAFYNENDPKAAAWLRELIKAGLIAPGVVDERSITDISPTDLHGFTQCHFFAGIGGWSYALRLAGVPDSVPVWTGSCPCQPFSAAGKGQGMRDERHLWPSFARLIDARRPAILFGEQVASKDGRLWLAGVFADLEGMGYRRAAADLCAAGLGAPHIRQRLYWLAYSGRECHELGRIARVLAGASDGAEGEAWERERSGDAFADCSAISGLADTGHEHPGRTARSSEAQGGRALGESPRCSDVVRLEHAESNGRQQRWAEPSGRSVASGCGIGGVANTDGGQCGNGGLQSGREHGLEPEDNETCGMGVANSTGPQQGRQAAATNRHGRPALTAGGHGHWSACELVHCTDGKARRVEPGSFPLAHGIPGRVGLLRGYGNAIVPQVAAEFIQAAISAIGRPGE